MSDRKEGVKVKQNCCTTKASWFVKDLAALFETSGQRPCPARAWSLDHRALEGVVHYLQVGPLLGQQITGGRGSGQLPPPPSLYLELGGFFNVQTIEEQIVMCKWWRVFINLVEGNFG